MRVLVTGGAGFLGSHLAERLAADGHTVVCLDNLSTGRRSNLAHLLGAGRVEFIEADVIDPLPDCGPFDRIFHLASPVTCLHHLARPIATLRAAAEGTRRTLDLATECGAVFVLASTSEVYGDPRVHPQIETDAGHCNPIGPRSPYDEGKRFAEALAVGYARERGTQVRIARIFNTYGPRMRPDDGRVIPTFMAQALAGRPLPVYGDGRQTRSFCYSSDMVEALVRLAEVDYSGPVNLGNPDEVTVLDLAREIVALVGQGTVPLASKGAAPVSQQHETGTAPMLEFSPMPEDDPVRRRPDIALARRLLGWEPRVPRQEGLRLMLEHYRQEESQG
jgi:dTDP-glucose 4,6-dehydratase